MQTKLAINFHRNSLWTETAILLDIILYEERCSYLIYLNFLCRNSDQFPAVTVVAEQVVCITPVQYRQRNVRHIWWKSHSCTFLVPVKKKLNIHSLFLIINFLKVKKNMPLCIIFLFLCVYCISRISEADLKAVNLT